MLPEVREATALLERTPAALRALLEGLGPEWLDAREGAGTWSPFEVMGHLADNEEVDWLPRLRLVLESGERVPFTPYEREGFRVSQKDRDLGARLSRFGTLRRENLAALAALGLTASDLGRTGMHPALGRVTVENLIAGWVVHDLTHLAQITRVLALRVAGKVGPWRATMGVLNR